MPHAVRPSYRTIFALAWPMVLANAAVPLLGLADTSVVGHFGTLAELGAIAVGSLVFSFLFWSFGFLRMGTTGFVAQANGAGNEVEVRAAVARAGLLAMLIGVLLLLLQWPLSRLAFWILDASQEVERIAVEYWTARIWGAPASLSTFVLMGTLIGLGRTRTLLWIQLFMNGLNIALDIWFVAGLDWGAKGVARGTAIAEWTTALLGFGVLYRMLRARASRTEVLWSWSSIGDWSRLLETLRTHRDIMLRTLLLLCGFGWFTQQGARFGDDVLAANHVLLQLISLGAFFLDGFAFAAESLVGTAWGARQGAIFDAAVRRSTQLAVGTAASLALFFLCCGERTISWLTDLGPVRQLTEIYLIYVPIYLVVAVWAFQLDGIFIGVTRTRDMRNAALWSLLAFLFIEWPLSELLGNHGLWIAFLGYAAARGLTLSLLYPRLRQAANLS